MEIGNKNPSASLSQYGIYGAINAYWNLNAEQLVEESIRKGMGQLADNGAVVIYTGEFTGRSPKDRFIVYDERTKDNVDWGGFNTPFETQKFQALRHKVAAYFSGKEVYIKDAYACADPTYRTRIRLISEFPWSSQFAGNMFIRPEIDDLADFEPDWTIFCAPGFHAVPSVDGTRQHNFTIVNFTTRQIIIGGSGYTGEIKKGIFSVLNFVLPVDRKVLPMHCSANRGKEGDVAVFFGLSGTGKTTLSADPNRNLIGDDEHGWSDAGVFNFEGGCYAKTIDLSVETEPDIYRAIKHGAIVENILFEPNSRKIDFKSKKITENTRVSYPISHIKNALIPSKAGHPTNIFFLTCDAFGILPPISKLTAGQAMYHFMSGYTAKIPGTEMGVTEPILTFSACFGAPFLPLHPAKYAAMLGERMTEHSVNVWLINTGWSGGGLGVGSRIKLRFTRAMITAALTGQLNDAEFTADKIFGLRTPKEVEGVPTTMLNPRNTWANKAAYDTKANELAESFNKNFAKFADQAAAEILAASPKPAKK